ncbi:DUF397 domain-containing protein [Streptomyces sp. NPDC059455]|uniref:DUF397 domain-containing protein n=1 Tax=Streptomyces sp. NPDC059455 TaxID=3346837 RepID=UPI0036A7C1A0
MSTYQWQKSSYSANSSNCINIAWRKSSYSADAGNCLNVAADGNGIALRESDDPSVILTTTPAALRAFIHGAKAGVFDRIQEGGA